MLQSVLKIPHKNKYINRQHIWNQDPYLSLYSEVPVVFVSLPFLLSGIKEIVGIKVGIETRTHEYVV